MLGTTRKAMTTMSMWRRSLWRYRVTTAGIALTSFGAATALNDLPTVVSGVAATAGCLVSVLEIRANRRRARLVRFQSRDGDNYRDLASQFRKLGAVVESAHDVGVVMARESVRLRSRPVRAEIASSPYQLPRELKNWSFDFLARRARMAAMYNGEILGLASDLPPDDDDVVVKLRTGRYFDFFCSNLLAPFDVWETGRKLPILRGRELILDQHDRLTTFRRSRLANTVGVSTLAFTTDGQLIIVAQAKDNVGSPGLFAPSSSGALEPCDAPQDGAGLTIGRIILNGAERELREECNISSDEVKESHIVGHGRWISRGAMPEFCAVTLLHLTSDQVLDRAIRRTERPYVCEVLAVDLSPIARWNPRKPLAMLPDKISLSASWPLAFGLACLAESINDPSWPVRQELTRRLTQEASHASDESARDSHAVDV
ncbi:hypothetical protein [Micromonospora rubida]|uniref:hypothetical protein n=1 Tax=Micromonospora rubida TaxID=2697657 RepID=UPI001376C6A5|nr:hypothetical protein [Micromonospora rubida]NBE85326.1 hypothetical protein [Micromonospora rubida]